MKHQIPKQNTLPWYLLIVSVLFQTASIAFVLGVGFFHSTPGHKSAERFIEKVRSRGLKVWSTCGWEKSLRRHQLGVLGFPNHMAFSIPTGAEWILFIHIAAHMFHPPNQTRQHIVKGSTTSPNSLNLWSTGYFHLQLFQHSLFSIADHFPPGFVGGLLDKNGSTSSKGRLPMRGPELGGATLATMGGLAQ